MDTAFTFKCNALCRRWSRTQRTPRKQLSTSSLKGFSGLIWNAAGAVTESSVYTVACDVLGARTRLDAGDRVLLQWCNSRKLKDAKSVQGWKFLPAFPSVGEGPELAGNPAV